MGVPSDGKAREKERKTEREREGGEEKEIVYRSAV